jgi:predicted TIM-barrel fold metal-dependent hydrolase
MGFPWEREDFCEEQNRHLARAFESSGGRIIPFGSVPMAATDVRARVRSIRELGLRGVGEVAFYNGMDSGAAERISALFAAVREYDLPVCLHVNEPVGHRYPGKYDPRLWDLYSALEDYQDITVIFSHWGGGLLFYELMPEVSKLLANCYYDTAASPFLYKDDIYALALRLAGPKRIMFGSDYPLIPVRRYLDSIEQTIGDTGWKAELLGMNAAWLLGIGR